MLAMTRSLLSHDAISKGGVSVGNGEDVTSHGLVGMPEVIVLDPFKADSYLSDARFDPSTGIERG
jgi:hypothetical protein